METTHGPVYQMVEKEIRDTSSKRSDFRKEMYYNGPEAALNLLLEKIEQLEPVWIPVSEKLPELGPSGGSPTVLTCDTEGNVGENCYFYGDELEEGEWSDDDYEIVLWMPMPLPPNE